MTISVILADDHTIVLDGLRLLLSAQQDIQVLDVAANGRDVLPKIEKFKPDVVVLDIAMPELNGIETAARVHQISPETAVIMLSMYASSEHVFQALNAGARGYLLKESAGMELVRAVRAVHTGSSYLSEKISNTVIDGYVKQRETTAVSSPITRLTSREREILQLVVEGKSSADIAQTLFLSPKTIDTYRSRLMQKLNIGDLPSLVKFAIQHGITPLE